jgi:hypothetical protein
LSAVSADVKFNCEFNCVDTTRDEMANVLDDVSAGASPPLALGLLGAVWEEAEPLMAALKGVSQPCSATA